MSLVPSRDALELAVIEPKPFQLRAVFCAEMAIMDPRSRKITQWVRGRLHAGTGGFYLEFWDRGDERLSPGTAHRAHNGDVIVEWPNGTFEVMTPEDYRAVYLQVGSEMWEGVGE